MNRYWNPATNPANWNDVNSWSATDGGATGETVPTIDDDVFFTGTNVNNCTINSNPAMNSLTTSGYTGVIALDTTGNRYFGVKTSITSTGTLKIEGNSTTARLLLQQANAAPSIHSPVGDGKLTINVAGIETKFVDFQDCIGAGAADWDLTKQATDSSGDCGGNSNITFTTAATQTWTNPAGGNWNDINNWSGRVPLPQDDCNMGIAYDNEATLKTIITNMVRAGKNIDFTGATWGGNLKFTQGSTAIFGNLTLVSGMITALSTTTVIFKPITPSYFYQNGATVSFAISINGRSTLLLGGDSPTTSPITVRGNSVFDTNGYELGAQRITLSGGKTYLRDKTHTFSQQLTLSANIPSSVLDAGTSTVKFALGQNDYALVGSTATSGLNFYNVWLDIPNGYGLTGTTIFQNNTFNEFKVTVTEPWILSFKEGSINTFNKFIVNGTAGNLVTIKSSGTSTDVHYLVKKTRGETVSNYLNVNNSIARPTKAWFAGNSTNGGGNNGWIFKLRGKRIMHNAIV